MGWYFGYLANVRMFLREDWGWSLGHFWSLAVEEQFYLVWPWVILFVPRRRLPAVVLGGIAVAPAFRYVVLRLTNNDLVGVLPFSCLDSLCLGAYLALGTDPGLRGHRWVRPLSGRVALAGLALMAVVIAAGRAHMAPEFWSALSDLGVALPAAWLVRRAAAGFTGAPGRWLGLAPLRYVGVISYGVYVYHYLLPEVLPKVARVAGHPHLLDPLGQGIHRTLWYPIFYTLATLGLASVSWYAFERPINRLKRYFEYGHRPLSPNPPAREPAGR